MNYKRSKYNIMITRGDAKYVWNTLSGAVAELDNDAFSVLSEESGDFKGRSDIEVLSENGFAVPENFDEYEYILKRSFDIMGNNTPEDLYFVIAPTLKCNYRCAYCFENSRTSFSDMSESVIIETERFIGDIISANKNLKRLHITWFGGEPLLRLDIIERLGDSLLDICKDKDIEYRTAIITNGRYLDSHAVDLLDGLNTRKVQISFDGTESSYCESKKATPEDYKATLANIALAAEKNLPVMIRINIRDNSFESAYNLADLLLGEMDLAGKIKIYPAFVNEGDVANRHKNYRKFVELEKAFAEYVRSNYSQDSYFNKLPAAHGISCALSCTNSFCVGPEGELYKCEHHFGQEAYRTGSIFFRDKTPFADEYRKITEKTVLKNECAKCPVFPICMGGCPNSTLLNEHNFDCEKFISHLIERQMRNIT